VALEVVLVGTADPLTYQQIARNALHLHELGLSDSTVAIALGVSDKTVRKAINWIQRR
jgi:hypothetical protein